MPTKKVPRSIEMPLMGIQHRVTPSTQHLLERMVVQQPIPISIEREPENRHDSNAIKVVIAEGKFKGMHIGYVPKATAAILAPAMDDEMVADAHGYITDLDEPTMLLQFKAAVKTTKATKEKGKTKRPKRKTA